MRTKNIDESYVFFIYFITLMYFFYYSFFYNQEDSLFDGSLPRMLNYHYFRRWSPPAVIMKFGSLKIKVTEPACPKYLPKNYMLFQFQMLIQQSSPPNAMMSSRTCETVRTGYSELIVFIFSSHSRIFLKSHILTVQSQELVTNHPGYVKNMALET